jgi:hypothetical protein
MFLKSLDLKKVSEILPDSQAFCLCRYIVKLPFVSQPEATMTPFDLVVRSGLAMALNGTLWYVPDRWGV